MSLHASEIVLRPRPRGVHLVTDEVVAALDLSGVATGLVHLFLQHTSAGLLLTENASPAVRRDLDRWLRDAVPDGWPPFEHTLEGPDDMPAHVGSALFGVSLTLPVQDGRLALGTWQGIALAELRDRGGARRVRATVVR
jgi:secondary thiamine-phosphate synthase enzyme